jgi:hypothetical protein
MIATTRSRVQDSSAPDVKDRIREKTLESIARYEKATHRELTYHLAELDHEWDIERVLELNFSSVVLAGIALGTFSNRRWYLLPAVAACFMVQHVIEGWCPPLAILRRLGFRTADEINRERTALKTLRGDFADVDVPGTDGPTTSSVLGAAEA